jgi:hypothetical protein
MCASCERAWRPTPIKRWTPAQVILFQPVGDGKRDHRLPKWQRGLRPLKR